MATTPPPYGPPPPGYPPGPPPPGSPYAAPQRRSSPALLIVIIVLVVLFVLSVAGVVAWYLLGRDGPAVPADGVSAGEPRIEGVQAFEDLPQDHSEDPVDYPQTPPAGGVHHPQWLNCGVYDQPVTAEHAVHSLEHGAVWITYQPGLDPAEVAVLEGYHQPGAYVIVSPYPDLPEPVVLSVWGRQLAVDTATDDRVDAFVSGYEQGPTTPEPGAPCSGGVDG